MEFKKIPLATRHSILNRYLHDVTIQEMRIEPNWDNKPDTVSIVVYYHSGSIQRDFPNLDKEEAEYFMKRMYEIKTGIIEEKFKEIL